MPSVEEGTESHPEIPPEEDDNDDDVEEGDEEEDDDDLDEEHRVSLGWSYMIRFCPPRAATRGSLRLTED